jgi:hypothetical protein
MRFQKLSKEMSTEPAAGRDISSDHFERNPGIEDSVTESYKDKAYAKQQE